MGGFLPGSRVDDQESTNHTPKVKDPGGQARFFDDNFGDLRLSDSFPDFATIEAWFDSIPGDYFGVESGMGGERWSAGVEGELAVNAGGVDLGLAGSGGAVKMEESEGRKFETLSGVSGGTEGRAGLVCGVADVGVIGGGTSGSTGGLGDVRAFVEREMGKVSLDCGLGDFGGVGDVIRGNTGVETGDVGIGSKMEQGGSGVVAGDGVRVKTELDCDEYDCALVVGGDLMKSDEKVDDGNNEEAYKGDEKKDSSEDESGSSSDASLPSSTSDEADDGDGEANQERMKVDKEMDEMEEGEIREAVGKELPAEKEIEKRDVDDENGGDVDEMVGWSNIEDEIDGFSDDDSEATGGPIKSKNELTVLPPVPSVNVKLEPHHVMVPVGVVLSILAAQVVVEGFEKHNPLNEGSILWITESRTPLGLVDEIFGPVKNPYYVVRYNSEAEIPAGVKERTLVSSVPEFASYVLNQKNLYTKGYDASGKNDEEVSDDEEFSDDEKEAEHKRMQRMAKRDVEMNERTHTNKKVNKKKDNGRKANWKPRPSAQQMPTSQSQAQPNQNLHSAPNRPASLDQGNGASSTIRPGFMVGNNAVPPFPSQMSSGGNSVLPFDPVLMNGIPLQRPNSALPSALSNGMLLPTPISQFPGQTSHFQVQTMALPNQMPFQVQFDPCQSILANVVQPGMQTNPFGDLASATWSFPLAQNSFNPPGVGPNTSFMLFTGGGDLGISLNGAKTDPNFNTLRPAAAMSPTMQGFGQFQPGVSSGRGNRSYHRGGGRFSGGRGRGRSN